MEIVINTDFGGFSLSPEAAQYVYEHGGAIETFDPAEYFDNNKEKEDSLKKFEKFGTEHGHWVDAWNKDRSCILDNYSIDRTDPILVAAVKVLGEKANGPCANLKVVEIPDGVEYKIHDYDGREIIHEVHRTWG